ncbi:MAG: NAD+ synthase [Gammaproteobacteria bacterium]|uniref:NAD+ synthase n=1 Tax=Hydrogenophaga sp. TaxID=1904254 RepID=UPI0025B8C0D5|nr:NAD+ synthase [Hydrogenophaga sp.]MBU4183051.1 NAD+ synthase [Gammaproteobacteria bacterium]MBU4280251.1 NAD+ synthase [Gammaproteobacteria bacterium]MBU4324665.1 NAD+ synthase [Gammaproteobacteria bacterium]MBU4508683.1 NAD+ synthase [Gammaproteobacteria bacterium]MCG2654612.1 NAD+ synthase [Hydrogenophaga sp.]
MIKVTLAQLNVTVGDMDGNVRKMIAAAQRARGDSADLVVFSELSLTGYYPSDLLDEPHFMARVAAGFEALLQASRQMPTLHWVVGLPAAHASPGKPLRNVLRVLRGGEVLLEYAKQLLPTYNIFNERRHFEPGPDVAKVLRIGSAQVGFLICEDGWNDDGSAYAVNPFDRLREAAPDVVISINASPSHIGKREQRHQIFAAASRRNQLPILYVNQIGGHDQLVYDGASFAVEPKAGVVFEARRFEEDVTTLRIDGHGFKAADGEPLPAVPAAGLPTMAFYRQQIVLGLRDYARRCGFTQAVVGSSGGIDSAITLALAAEAFGPDRVTAITMPSVYSSAGSVDDSKTLCDGLGVHLFRHPIAELVQGYSAGFEAAFGSPLQGLALENLQARIRGTILMAYSNTWGHLLLTTGNKSEMSVGYCTLYGDTNGGLGLIGDLYKTEVFALSRHLNEAAGREIIPRAIIDKPPSAELAPDQKDTDSLPPYEVLDEVLKHLIEGHGLAHEEREQVGAYVARLVQQPDGAALVERIRHLVARSEYKRRQAPPVIRVRARAFGSGRQMPIAAQHF